MGHILGGYRRNCSFVLVPKGCLILYRKLLGIAVHQRILGRSIERLGSCVAAQGSQSWYPSTLAVRGSHRVRTKFDEGTLTFSMGF